MHVRCMNEQACWIALSIRVCAFADNRSYLLLSVYIALYHFSMQQDASQTWALTQPQSTLGHCPPRKWRLCLMPVNLTLCTHLLKMKWVNEFTSLLQLLLSQAADFLQSPIPFHLLQVHRLPVEECSNFTDCSTCITGGGLLCGWCTVEIKCSRRPQCANSSNSDGLRWVQTTDRCLTVDIASAVSISGEKTAYPRETTSIVSWEWVH